MTTPKFTALTPKVTALTPKVGGVTPKVSGLTPGPIANLGFSPSVYVNSPATQRRGQNLAIGSPANLPLTFTPGTTAAAEMVSSLGYGGGLGRTPVYLQNSTGAFGPLAPDENKKRELEDILRTLALKPGRISVKGIERLAKRLGLKLDCEEKENGGQMLSLSGTIIVVDIDFMGNNITQVAVSFANTLGTSNDLAPLAAGILKKNLQPPKPLLISDLGDFASNLERLSKLDRLSTAHSLNCFTAITGLYESLSIIHIYEQSFMDAGMMDAMCQGNGRPRMHYNGKVGLSVEYWRERRKMQGLREKDRDLHMGGMNEEDGPANQQEDNDGKQKTWRVIIEIDELGPECSSLDTIRTTENWVGKNITRPSDDSMFGDDEYVIDWLDPEPSVENLMEVDSSRPNARFIARLDPPIVVPLLDEVTIFSNLGLYSPPGQIGATTLDGILFPRAQVPDMPPLTVERKIHLPSERDPQLQGAPSVTHQYTLHVLKPIYAREVWEIPFGHPRQLGPILQIFRQYVLLSTLLRSCFSPSSSSTPCTNNNNTIISSASILQPNLDDLDSFLSNPAPGPTSPSIPIDISLSADPPSPVLRVLFPSHLVPQRLISLEVEVSRNAAVAARYSIVDTPEQIARQGGVGVGMGKGGLVGEEVVTRAVDLIEDIGVVVEWLRRKM